MKNLYYIPVIIVFCFVNTAWAQTDSNCYTAPTGIIGNPAWNGCANMYIASTNDLRGVASSSAGGNGDFYIDFGSPSVRYTFTDDANNIFTGQVTDMSRLFQNTSFNGDIGYWDTSRVTNMSAMFVLAASANPDVSNWDVSKVTNMNNMFALATSASPNTSNWNTSSVTNMASMFQNATAANPDTSNWNTSMVTSMSGMFQNATAANPNTSNWNTSMVRNMPNMFSGATSANPDTSNWDTSSVTDMGDMFSGATAANPDTSNWNTSSVTTMTRMFQNATMANPDVSNWDTSSVTRMGAMFNGATSANPDVSNWDTSSVTDMSFMFSGATSLDRDLSGLDLDAVTGLNNMLDNSGLSIASYDATLRGWSMQTLRSGPALGVAGLEYCTAATERQSIITTYSWTFSGDSMACAQEIAISSSESGAVADSDTDAQGNEGVGTAKTVTYTITNTGGSTALTLSGAASVSNLTNITSTPTVSPYSSTSLTQGQTATFSVTYTPATAGAFSFEIDITSNDADENPYDITVSGIAVNNAPTASGVPTDVTVTEDSASNVDLSAITFADVDSASITVTLTASAGTFSTPADGAGVVGGITETLVNLTTITLAGAPADINTYIDTASNIQYTGSSNVNGNNAATITITANDGDGSGNVNLGIIYIDITAVNDAPILGGTPADDSATEDVATAIDLSVYNILDVDSSQITLTLAVDRGTIASTDGNGTTAGVVVASSGTASMTLTGTATDLNIYLNDLTKITYTTALNDTTTATLTVTPNDGTANGTADTVNINITGTPDIFSAHYDAATNLLTVTGDDLIAITGSNNDIDASLLTLTGEGGNTYTLTDTADVEITSATEFTVTLSATDRAAVNNLFNKDGTSAADGTTYNLSAATGYNGTSTADVTNTVTVSNAVLSVVDLKGHTILAYPVPVKDQLTIELGVYSIGVLRLYNVLGGKVLEKSIATAQARLDMQVLPAGIYLIRIETNHIQQTLKVMKE